MPDLPVLPRKRQRREPKPTEASEPVAQHPATFGFGTAQPARSRKPLAPSFWGEGRRGGERAETEGTPANESTEGIAQVAKTGFVVVDAGALPGVSGCPALARRDACPVNKQAA